MKNIRVLIVDDSAVVRKTLSNIINNEPNMEVVGTAPDPYVARDKLISLKPDVMTLDIEMPRMDGMTFLKKVMHYFPIPIVIVSSVTKQGCKVSMKALELGAISVVPKPSEAYSIESIERNLIDAVKSASFAIIKKIEPSNQKKQTPLIQIKTTNKIIAIGASTGGTEALKEIITNLPLNIPGLVVVQHMPPGFTLAFAERLNLLSKIEVKEAKDGDAVLPGSCLIAPGDYHLLLRRIGARYIVKLKKGPQVWHQRPAVDVLFKSVSEYAGENAIGVILTGMGKDGAEGMRLMKNKGSINIAQDEETCVVYGMPKAAVDTGAVDYIVPINNIANEIIEIVNNKL
ncbi:MAG: chemotaxis response regulator protein-glutamate methylesterase [Candidatus Cloacimonetes bacterium]|nr:chemotaxis response regulator protein-glutamate methylesterase [Candidatus Cloacimonadota bacterium]